MAICDMPVNFIIAILLSVSILEKRQCSSKPSRFKFDTDGERHGKMMFVTPGRSSCMVMREFKTAREDRKRITLSCHSSCHCVDV